MAVLEFGFFFYKLFVNPVETGIPPDLERFRLQVTGVVWWVWLVRLLCFGAHSLTGCCAHIDAAMHCPGVSYTRSQ